MHKANHHEFGEKELAQINARHDLSSAFGADDWDDAVASGATDRAMACDSFVFAADDNQHE